MKSTSSLLLWLSFLSTSVGLLACGSGKSAQENNAAAAPLDTTLCFLRLEGQAFQDSTFVYLDIAQDTVTGIMNWIPAEKDARRGMVYGMHSQDTLNLTWTFIQEGREDTLHTRFLLQDGVLKQQEFAVDSVTGRQYTAENGAFSLEYTTAPCPDLDLN